MNKVKRLKTIFYRIHIFYVVRALRSSTNKIYIRYNGKFDLKKRGMS